MRIATSAIALVSIIVATFSPALGQSNRRLPSKREVPPAERPIQRVPDPRPGNKPDRRIPVAKTEAQFASIEAFTEGKGVWIRWRMEMERKNAGFTVYALSKNGPEPVSNFIAGSWFTYGEQEHRGGEYYYYHPDGGMDHGYLIEAMDDNGRTVRTKLIVPTYVPSIEWVEGGAEMKADTFAFKPGANVVKEDLNVSYELQQEVRNGLIQPNPSKHLEVISQPGARIASRADGLIRVSRTELENGGFDVNSSSSNWQIYLEGVELPMIVGPNADYIEFFGKGLDTRESDIRTYYLINGTTAGRRIANQVARRPTATIVSRKYNQTFVRQDKKNYSNQVLNGDEENWWGDLIASGFIDHKFNLSGIDRTAGTRKLTVAFQGFSITPHSVELSLNGTPLPNITGAGRFPFSGTIDVPVEILLDGENTLRMRSVGAQGDFSFLSKVMIEFPRDYVAMSNKLEFYTDNYKNAKASGFTTQNIRIFDVTYENEPRQLTNVPIVETNGTWGPLMPAGRERILFAVGEGVHGSAMSVTPNDPAILADPGHAATMVLIAHPNFIPQAETWATFRAGQGISTKVVDVTDIYDEFSYGVLSSYAIEAFLNYAKNNWQTPPSYVMLFGEAHYDSRNYRGEGYWNMVPSRLVDTLFTETGSDEALSDFNNDGLAEIPIGRAASRDGAGITALYNKTVAWEASLNANSLNRGALFAYDHSAPDINGQPTDYDFEAMSNRVMSNLPAQMPKTTVRRCEVSGTNCNQTADKMQAIVDGLNDLDGGTLGNPGPNAGQFILNYTGHGTASVWKNTSFFSSCNVLGNACNPQAPAPPQLTNANFPSLIIALTCLNGYFMGNVDTFAEAMTRSSDGGAVAVWASTGLTTPDVQEIMGSRFYLKIGEGNIPRLGDLIADAKARVPAGADVRLSWALLGDPMLKVR